MSNFDAMSPAWGWCSQRHMMMSQASTCSCEQKASLRNWWSVLKLDNLRFHLLKTSEFHQYRQKKMSKSCKEICRIGRLKVASKWLPKQRVSTVPQCCCFSHVGTRTDEVFTFSLWSLISSLLFLMPTGHCYAFAPLKPRKKYGHMAV